MLSQKLTLPCPKISANLDIFRHGDDSEDAKTSYAEPKVGPFHAPRFQQIWIFFAMGVIVKTQKHRTLSQKLTLSMPQDFSKFGYFSPWGMERVNFWLSVQCFYVFTITPSAKKIQIC